MLEVLSCRKRSLWRFPGGGWYYFACWQICWPIIYWARKCLEPSAPCVLLIIICFVTTDWKISLPLFISGKAMGVNLCGPIDACIMARLLFWRVFRLIRSVIKDITHRIMYPLYLISRLEIFIIVWDVKVSSMGNYTRQEGINVAFLFQHILQWRHNGRDGVPNRQPHDCLLNRLFGCKSKKTSKLHVTGLCAGNSLVTGEFPSQMASNAEKVSIWWRHHGLVDAPGLGTRENTQNAPVSPIVPFLRCFCIDRL